MKRNYSCRLGENSETPHQASGQSLEYAQPGKESTAIFEFNAFGVIGRFIAGIQAPSLLPNRLAAENSFPEATSESDD
jgi:hypothetical protein